MDYTVIITTAARLQAKEATLLYKRQSKTAKDGFVDSYEAALQSLMISANNEFVYGDLRSTHLKKIPLQTLLSLARRNNHSASSNRAA